MTNPTNSQQFEELLDSTIDDYLVNLAQGIQQAQRQLNLLTVSGQPGQPAVAYHMPRVEFELKMTFSLRSETPPAAGSASARAAPNAPQAPPPKGRLVWQPVRPGTGSSESFSSEATSTIRGSFVAVPVAGGRPPPVVRTTLARKDPRQVAIKVQVTDALGAPQPDVEVQFNVDRDRSFELSRPVSPPSPPRGPVEAALGAPAPSTEPLPTGPTSAPKRPLQRDTDLTLGVVRTGPDGQAESLLRIAAAEPRGTVVVVIIDALTAAETVLVKVE